MRIRSNNFIESYFSYVLRLIGLPQPNTWIFMTHLVSSQLDGGRRGKSLVLIKLKPSNSWDKAYIAKDAFIRAMQVVWLCSEKRM